MTRRKVLTDAQIVQLRVDYKPGVRGSGYTSLARPLGVGASTVRDALKYKTEYSARAH